MAKKKVELENVVQPSKARREVKTIQAIIEESKKAKEVKRKKMDDYKKVECPDLNLRQLYNFEFNQNVKNKLLRGSIRRVTGELAMHYIRSNYGILC
jgi:hypothetical protein